MPYFGTKSKQRLATCDERLQKVFNEVIKYVDCSVLEGHRGQERQDKLYEEGKTKLKFPNGRHNMDPSNAVDVTPYPVDWKDRERWMDIMIASGTLPFLVKTPSLIDGRRKFDGGIADPLPVKKAYEMGANKIIIIRTYEKEFRRKIKLET